MSLRAVAPLAGLLACLLAGCQSYYRDSPGRTVGELTDDSAIGTAVKSKLIRHADTHGWRIDVDTFRGVVTLTGFVKSEAERGIALDLARNTKGVKQVDDRLSVVPAPDS